MTSTEQATTILLTGASGFVGQHVLQALLTLSSKDTSHNYHIYALHGSKPELADAIPIDLHHHRCTVVQLDLTNAADCEAWMASRRRHNTTDSTAESTETIDLCLHTAALSTPGACQKDPARATAINVPTHFFEALRRLNPNVHVVALSTDQVYDGCKRNCSDSDTSSSLYRETSPVGPCNVYAKTKVQLEEYLLGTTQQTSSSSPPFSNVTILRSSIVLGPPAPYIPAHGTFLDFCASRVGQATTYYTDEIRSVVSMHDVRAVLLGLVARQGATTTIDSIHRHNVYCMGGPAPVSRHAMAVAVVARLGGTVALAQPALKASATAASTATSGGVPSPLDIGMDSTALRDALGLPAFRSLEEIVAAQFPSPLSVPSPT